MACRPELPGATVTALDRQHDLAVVFVPMSRNWPDPLIVEPARGARRLERLRRAHAEFDEAFLQELLAEHPDVIPVTGFRADAGRLLCIGREVPTGSGTIDNLYLSTGGYPVLVETKLWRNPQARREVVSQVLDYVKDLVNRDFAWLAARWTEHARSRGLSAGSLIEAMDELADDEVDEPDLIDRVNRALAAGDVIALIVGDGIETRLRELVAHLMRDSAHLRYSLALVELACYELGGAKPRSLLVVPRIIREVAPVERAYVRIEASDELRGMLDVESIAEPPDGSQPGRPTLDEEKLRRHLKDALGPKTEEHIRHFYKGLTKRLGLEPDFKSAALMLKIPDPAEEKPGASVLAIHRDARAYNPQSMRRLLERWGLPADRVESITSRYWERLHSIHEGFLLNGMSPKFKASRFVRLSELVDALGAIEEEIAAVVAEVRECANEHR